MLRIASGFFGLQLEGLKDVSRKPAANVSHRVRADAILASLIDVLESLAWISEVKCIDA